MQCFTEDNKPSTSVPNLKAAHNLMSQSYIHTVELVLVYPLTYAMNVGRNQSKQINPTPHRQTLDPSSTRKEWYIISHWYLSFHPSFQENSTGVKAKLTLMIKWDPYQLLWTLAHCPLIKLHTQLNHSMHNSMFAEHRIILATCLYANSLTYQGSIKCTSWMEHTKT